ncbi:MAG: trigger factor [Deltaproteobacteria bacterium]|nr:trigger factor [Deltaproteobacteria bacterium]
MKTSFEEISPIRRRLIVELDAEEVSKKLDDAYLELKKNAKVHGFRPGKAPREILERYYGGEVAQDVTRGLVKETLPLAFEETKTYPLTMPLVENDLLKKGEGFKYAAVIEVKPSFELGDYMGLELEKEKIVVSDDDVDRKLEEIRKANATLKPLDDDRGACEDDSVLIDYEAFEGESLIEGIKSENLLVRIGTSVIHPDFEKGLVGVRIGESKEITVDFEPDYGHAKLAGKRVTFKVQVKDIKVTELPELNDAFAAGLGGGFTDLETVRKKVKEDLTALEEKRLDQELKRRLLDKISEGVDFELPDSLVEAEQRYAVENVKQNLRNIGSSFEKSGLTEEKIRQDFLGVSRKRVKDLLILGEVASRNNLTINEIELSEGLNKLAQDMGQDPATVRRYYEARGLVENFRERLLEEKTLNLLVNNARITEVGPNRPKTEEAGLEE